MNMISSVKICNRANIRARVRALLIVHGTLTSILSHEERMNNHLRKIKTMRKTIIFVALATILATIFPAEAQQPAKMPKIGEITSVPDRSKRLMEIISARS